MTVTSPETQSLDAAEAAFRQHHPSYADTTLLDELRRSDFSRLDRSGHVYLDYTGGGLYAESQLREHLRLLQDGVFGNPHSINPTSAASTELVERARASVLDFFRASPEEYEAIFTPNATGALRLVGEAYPFHRGDRFLLTFDNHNSVNGIREFARARGARDDVHPERRAGAARRGEPARALPDRHRRRSPQPVRLPGAVELLGRAASAGVDRAGARARLGRAARRRRVRADQPARPERVAPRLRGALVLQDVRLADRRRLFDRASRRARQARAAVVLRRDDRRRVRAAPVLPVRTRRRALRGRHRQLPQPPGGRDRPAVPRPGWDRDDPRPRRARSGPGCSTRSARCATATAHPPPRSTAHDLGSVGARRSRSTSCTPTAAWSTSATSTGSPTAHNISLRTGCFCNPGAGEVAFTIARETLLGGEFGEGMTLDDYVRTIGLPSGGAIRASLGLASNFADRVQISRLRRRIRRPQERPR